MMDMALNVVRESVSAFAVIVAVMYGIRFWREPVVRPRRVLRSAGQYAAIGAAAGCLALLLAWNLSPAHVWLHAAYIPLLALPMMRQPAWTVASAGAAIQAVELVMSGYDGDVFLAAAAYAVALALYIGVAVPLHKSRLSYKTVWTTVWLHLVYALPACLLGPEGLGGDRSLLPWPLVAAVTLWSMVVCGAGGKAVALMEKETAEWRSLQDEVYRDYLTRMYNIRFFHRWYGPFSEKAAKRREPFALLFLDIDDFKKINDSFGHEAGDRVLRETAAKIRSQLRVHDIALRYGGEEFVVVLPSCKLQQAVLAAERIRIRVAEEAVVHGGAVLPVTVSIGVSAYPELPGERLLAEADKALYRAKEEGKNRVKVYRQ